MTFPFNTEGTCVCVVCVSGPSGSSEHEQVRSVLQRLHRGVFHPALPPAAAERSRTFFRVFLCGSDPEQQLTFCPLSLSVSVCTDFQMMFPDAPPSALTVVTVTQRTVNDMTAWSPEVEQEREVLLSKVGQ